jgi:hypothetical protein
MNHDLRIPKHTAEHSNNNRFGGNPLLSLSLKAL